MRRRKLEGGGGRRERKTRKKKKKKKKRKKRKSKNRKKGKRRKKKRKKKEEEEEEGEEEGRRIFFVFFFHPSIAQDLQDDTFIDCGLYTCSFAEFVCHGDMDIFMSIFDAENLRLRYEALLWNYGKRKIDTDTVSEDDTFLQGG
ncbi:hypothetical protein RDI58_022164 [Solanum bulbocastanum]|uniref:Ubiquitin-like protease family profile domain-containing protein n=1 Tax=Solanum bulbocastanum TaxID=147425 RepID=A0AAN8Y4Z6_SOLBU